MAVLAEDMVDRAVHALLEGSDAMARQVREDDDQLDRREQEVDELAVNLLAAGAETQDLRAITVGLKKVPPSPCRPPPTSTSAPLATASARWRSTFSTAASLMRGP